jgi:hypothetical protein
MVKLRAIASFLALQLGWFACVLGATSGHGWFGPVLVVAVTAGHVAVQPARARATELILVAGATALGALIETAFLRTGVTMLPASVAPPWLVALWPNTAIATTREGSLGRLFRHPALAAVVGFIAAPLSYWAGVRLGALGFGDRPSRSMAVIGVVWALLLPSAFALRQRVDRTEDLKC